MMPQDTDDQMTALFQRAMGDVAGEELLITRATALGERQIRRRRLSYGLGAAAVAATAVVIPLNWPGSANTPVAAEHGGQAAYAGAPSGSAQPGATRVPTPVELSTELAQRLPAGSTEIHSERRQDGGALVVREVDGGTVRALAYDFEAVHGTEIDPAQMRTRCSHQSAVSGCETTDDGWTTWTAGHPDVLGADPDAREARVTYYQRNGDVIDLTSTNYTDIDSASNAEPVLSRDELIGLATSVAWFPTR